MPMVHVCAVCIVVKFMHCYNYYPLKGGVQYKGREEKGVKGGENTLGPCRPMLGSGRRACPTYGSRWV